MLEHETISTKIKRQAIALGFDDVGIAKVQNTGKLYEHLESWIQKGYHGSMEYMRNNIETRSKPILYVPEAKSVIVVIVNYYQENIKSKSKYKIAQFAHVQDYHYVLKEKLNQLLSFIVDIEPKTVGKISVDAQPVAERYWAVQAGLGFIGQNTMFIHPKLGSFNFIGSIVTNLELDSDTPSNETCLGCGKCISSCPNGAIVEPYTLDSQRCISYQTIESRSESIFNERIKFENYIFGCDICNLVCPHNENIPLANKNNFAAKPEITNMTDDDWNTLGSSQFKRRFSHSPLRRAGLRGIRRNILWCNKK